MGNIRLDKFLADCGVGTRSEVKKYIKNGRVLVNGVPAKDGAEKIDSATDKIMMDNEFLTYEEFRYFLLNKPAGCVSATRDRLSETVLEFLSGEMTGDLFPVGRLDKDTEGLLLITNDGMLAHNLLSPKKHVDKVYRAVVTGKLSEKAERKFASGIDIGDDKPCLPAEIKFISEEGGGFMYEVTLHEGRFHQVKRMFEAVGETVTYLKRISMGSLKLDPELEPGEYRRLTQEEIDSLKNR